MNPFNFTVIWISDRWQLPAVFSLKFISWASRLLTNMYDAKIVCWYIFNLIQMPGPWYFSIMCHDIPDDYHANNLQAGLQAVRICTVKSCKLQTGLKSLNSFMCSFLHSYYGTQVLFKFWFWIQLFFFLKIVLFFYAFYLPTRSRVNQ